MQYVHSIEKTMREWYKDVPHLPKEFTKWVAENAWWLVLIGVIFGAFGVFGTLSVLGIGFAYVAAFAPVVGIALVGLWLSLLVSIVALVIEALSISPLKAMKRRGWDLSFLAMIVGTGGGAVVALLHMDILGVFFDVIGFAIGTYVLLELSHYFNKA